MSRISDYCPRGSVGDKITAENLTQIRRLCLDVHTGAADGAIYMAVMTQYIDLLLEAAERDIKRRPKLSRG